MTEVSEVTRPDDEPASYYATPVVCGCGCGCEPDGDWHRNESRCACAALGCPCVNEKKDVIDVPKEGV